MSQTVSTGPDITTRSCSECPAPPDCLVLDVRSPTEFEAAHVPGSRLLPLDQLNPEHVRKLATDQPVYLLCGTGKRAARAAEKLNAAGLSNIVVVEGGLNAWQATGRQVRQSERKGVSIERQVRVTTGALVVLGVLLGFSIHPAFHGLSAFIGAGLVFAGLTDWCGMGLAIAKAPWNNRLGENARKALVKG